MTDERKPKVSVDDPYQGLDDIAGELGFPERASGWPDAGSRENCRDRRSTPTRAPALTRAYGSW